MLDYSEQSRARLKIILFAFVLCGAAVASGGPLQVYFSKYFWCGRIDAGPQLHVLIALAAIQIVHFLFAQCSKRASTWYRVLQWIAIILCGQQIIMLAQAYPTTFSFLGLALAASFGAALVIVVCCSAREAGELFGPQLLLRLPYLAALSVLLLVQWLVVSGLISQFFLYRPATPLTAMPLAFSLILGAAIAVAGGWSFHKRNNEGLRDLRLAAFPPLFVLLLALLRAKYPDGAFDTLLYKGTWPYQIAEWRTAGMAALDHTGLGSNFQEMFNGLLIILAPDYNPSLISTLSITALFMVLPFCINLTNSPFGISRLTLGFATAVIISLTEPAMAQGTTYQEPFIVLLLTLALLNAWNWPIFLSAAIAVKLTAVFAVPLIFVFKFVSIGPQLIVRLWKLRFAIVAAIGLIAIFVLPQLDRNLMYSGRVFGLTETFARWTDPPRPNAMLVAGGSENYKSLPRGGLLSNFTLSACNAFAFDLFCDVTYQGVSNLGFHVLPSSRAPLVGLLLAVTIIIAVIFARARSALAVLGSLAFVIGYLGFLSQVAEGRYFVVPSFMLAVLALCVDKMLASTSAVANNPGGRAAILCGGLLALIPIGDLLTGTFINDGWDCRRNLFDRAETYSINRPNSDAEKFLANLAKQYRNTCPAPGLSPTILNAVLLMPYLGMHMSTSPLAQDWQRRFFENDTSREKNIPLAIAAVVVRDAVERQQFTRSQDSEFTPCFQNKDLQIFCSKKLAPTGPDCAHSLLGLLDSTRVPGQQVK